MKITTLEKRLEKSVLRASYDNQKKYAYSVVKQFNQNNKGEKAFLSFDSKAFLVQVYVEHNRVFAKNFDL